METTLLQAAKVADEAITQIKKTFGAPGDWGYETDLGKLLFAIYKIQAGLRGGIAADDGYKGMEWWNGLSDDDRKQWAVKAGNTGRASDAWEAFKRQKAEG